METHEFRHVQHIRIDADHGFNGLLGIFRIPANRTIALLIHEVIHVRGGVHGQLIRRHVLQVIGRLLLILPNGGEGNSPILGRGAGGIGKHGSRCACREHGQRKCHAKYTLHHGGKSPSYNQNS